MYVCILVFLLFYLILFTFLIVALWQRNKVNLIENTLIYLLFYFLCSPFSLNLFSLFTSLINTYLLLKGVVYNI